MEKFNPERQEHTNTSGVFEFHVSIPKIFKETGKVDLEKMREIGQLIRTELGGKIKVKYFVGVKNYGGPPNGA